MKIDYLQNFKRDMIMEENGYTMTSEDSKVYIPCSCGLEIIQVEKDEETKDVYFAIFNYGKHRRNLWTRIKYAWKMITKNEVFGDQIVISPEEAKKLSNYLNGNN